MKNLVRILFKNRIKALLIAILALIPLSYASISFAKTGKQAEEKQEYCMWYQMRRYYSDATYTTHTATKVWFCDGSVGSGGAPTPYYIDSYCECDPEGGGKK